MFLLKKVIKTVVAKVTTKISTAKEILQNKAHTLVHKLESKAAYFQDKADDIREKSLEKADSMRDHYAQKAAEARECGNEQLASKYEKIGEIKANAIEASGEKKALILEKISDKYQAKADALKSKIDKGDLKDEDLDDKDDDGIEEPIDEEAEVEVKFFVDANGDGNPFYFIEIQAPEDFDPNNPDFDQFFDEVQEQMIAFAEAFPDQNLSTDPVTAVIQATVTLPDGTIIDYENPFADDETISDLSTGELSDDVIPDEDEDEVVDG